MTPRPYRPDPKLRIVFGHWPLDGDEGIVPDRLILSNPPRPEHGMTLIAQRRGKAHWRRLRKSDLLSQQESAAFLQVSRMQVNRWVNGGELSDRKILGTSRIAVSTLLAFAKKKSIPLVRGLWFVN